jgi:hypothetical protein
MLSVESDHLAEVGYDINSNTLRVRFKGGALYEYDQVPVDKADGLMQSESKHHYFAIEIRGKYAYRKVPQ